MCVKPGHVVRKEKRRPLLIDLHYVMQVLFPFLSRGFGGVLCALLRSSNMRRHLVRVVRDCSILVWFLLRRQCPSLALKLSKMLRVYRDLPSYTLYEPLNFAASGGTIWVTRLESKRLSYCTSGKHNVT